MRYDYERNDEIGPDPDPSKAVPVGFTQNTVINHDRLSGALSDGVRRNLAMKLSLHASQLETSFDSVVKVINILFGDYSTYLAAEI